MLRSRKKLGISPACLVSSDYKVKKTEKTKTLPCDKRGNYNFSGCMARHR